MAIDNNPYILIIEDTESLAVLYQAALEEKNFHASAVSNGTDAIAQIKTNPPAMLVLDLKLPDMEGIELLKTVKSEGYKGRAVVITGHGSMKNAIEAMRHGAQDFLVKPFPLEKLQAVVENEMQQKVPASPPMTMPHEMAGLSAENQTTGELPSGGPKLEDPRNTPAAKNHSFGGFIGTSPVMQDVYKKIENAARSDATIFITGESGTGKEVCAEAIHKHSRRANKPFIPINCAAIPRDLMESELFGHVKGAFTGAISDREGAASLANGGTLFLDEIAEMHPDMQTKLLRFLQNLTFMKVGGSRLETTDIRIICATNRDPAAEVRNGNFREDLFYRLYVVPIDMPALRERGEDIIDLAQTFLRRYAALEEKSFYDLSDDTCNELRFYAWPGNIRQLQNEMRRIAVMHEGDIVTTQMLSPQIINMPKADNAATAAPATSNGTNNRPLYNPPRIVRNAPIRLLADIEREVIEDAIARCGNNIPKAATALGVSPSTIYRKKTGWEEDATASTHDAQGRM